MRTWRGWSSCRGLYLASSAHFVPQSSMLAPPAAKLPPGGNYIQMSASLKGTRTDFFFFIIQIQLNWIYSFPFFSPPQTVTLKNRGPILDESQVASGGLHHNCLSQTSGLKPFWLYLIFVTEIEQQSHMSQGCLLPTLTSGFRVNKSQTSAIRFFCQSVTLRLYLGTESESANDLDTCSVLLSV